MSLKKGGVLLFFWVGDGGDLMGGSTPGKKGKEKERKILWKYQITLGFHGLPSHLWRHSPVGSEPAGAYRQSLFSYLQKPSVAAQISSFPGAPLGNKRCSPARSATTSAVAPGAPSFLSTAVAPGQRF